MTHPKSGARPPRPPRLAQWLLAQLLPAESAEVIAASTARRRFALTLFELFGAVAVLLTVGGIYGVLSQSVAEQAREIGVRAALGASRRDILGHVVRQGLSLTLIGTTIGAGLWLALAPVMPGCSTMSPPLTLSRWLA